QVCWYSMPSLLRPTYPEKFRVWKSARCLRLLPEKPRSSRLRALEPKLAECPRWRRAPAAHPTIPPATRLRRARPGAAARILVRILVRIQDGQHRALGAVAATAAGKA